MSAYSSESPGYLRRLSTEDEVEDHDESEYEDIAAATAWNSSVGGKDTDLNLTDASGYAKFLPWTTSGDSAYRRPSIISISPRGSPSRSSITRRVVCLDSPIDANRRGSNSSLLVSPSRDRRRSSNQSHTLLQEVLQRRASVVSTTSVLSEASSRATEGDHERDQIAMIRSMDGLGRRFSEVVEVEPRSPDSSSSGSDEEDRDYTPRIIPGRQGAINMWSPDTEDIPTDDESEVQSPASIAIPEIIRQPMSFSNFPLTSVATAADLRAEAQQFPRDIFASRLRHPVETPSPEMAPAEFLRRLREPAGVRGWMPQIQPVADIFDERSPGPASEATTETISSKLFRHGRTKSLSEIPQQEGTPAAAALLQPLNLETKPNPALPLVGASTVEAGSHDEGPAPEIKRGSFADGVEEFGFLASEISVGSPRQTGLSPLLTPRPAGRTLAMPTFSMFDSPPMATPTVKFDAMAAFLGKPTGIASAPVSPRRPDLVDVTPTVSTTKEEYFPTAEVKARPISLQVLPRPNDQTTEAKFRPRSGGLAISNTDFPLALLGHPTWSSEWIGEPRFPGSVRAERPGLGHRSVTMPTVKIATSPRGNRILRKPVPTYSPLTECDEPHMLPDGTVLRSTGSGAGTSSNGSSGIRSPRTAEEQAEHDRRQQRRAEKSQCRRCREKRALRLLTESIMMGMDSEGSHRQAAHSHGHRHHHRQQRSHDGYIAREELVSASSGYSHRFIGPTSSSTGFTASGHGAQAETDQLPYRMPNRQSLPARTLPPASPPPAPPGIATRSRPGLVNRSYSERPSGPYPVHPRVTYAPPIVVEAQRGGHHYPKAGPAISGPILLSSTSKNLEVQRSLASAIPHSDRVEGPRPTLRRSASTSESRRVSKRGTFARLLHAFDPHHGEDKASRRVSRAFMSERQ